MPYCDDVYSRYTIQYELQFETSLKLFFYSISIFCSCESFLNKQISSGVGGCGVVGRAVASESRDPWFESSHRQDFLLSTGLVSCVVKTKKNFTTSVELCE